MRPDRAAAALFAAALIASTAAGAQTPAPAEVTLAMNAPGSGNWPVYIADQQGFFRDEGLHVTMVLTGSNTSTINAVAGGDAQFGLDGSDIEIEAVAHGLALKIVAPEFGPNPYTLVVAATVRSWDELKGKTVVLGSPQDVSSLTFARLAALHHLSRADFSIVDSPSSSSRYAALLSGNVQATVLSQPFDILAEQSGFHALARGSDVLKPWADTCFAVNGRWAAGPASRATIVHFVRALRKAVRYGYASPDGAIAALVRATNVAPAVARAAYEADFRDKHVFDINDRIDLRDGLAAMSASTDAGSATVRIDDVFDSSYLNDSAK